MLLITLFRVELMAKDYPCQTRTHFNNLCRPQDIEYSSDETEQDILESVNADILEVSLTLFVALSHPNLAY